MANATGIYTLVRQLGGSLGIAILQFLQTRYQDNAYATLASGVTPANPAVSPYLHDLHGTARNCYAMVMLNATVISYDVVLRLCGIIFVLVDPARCAVAAASLKWPGGRHGGGRRMRRPSSPRELAGAHGARRASA